MTRSSMIVLVDFFATHRFKKALLRSLRGLKQKLKILKYTYLRFECLKHFVKPVL